MRLKRLYRCSSRRVDIPRLHGGVARPRPIRKYLVVGSSLSWGGYTAPIVLARLACLAASIVSREGFVPRFARLMFSIASGVCVLPSLACLIFSRAAGLAFLPILL